MKTLARLRHALTCIGAACAFAGFAGGASAQTLCVYDPLGTGGDYYSLFQDYQLAAKRWGVTLDLKVYADDTPLRTAFINGQCDAATMIGMRAREFNKFTGTLDAPGVLDNYNEVRESMLLMASPKLAKYMVSGGYEVVGVLPVGGSYPIVNDRHINSLAHAAGKRVTVMEWDKTQSIFTETFKAIPVPVEASKYGATFNEGKADVSVAPIMVYKALEMSRGVGSKGGIVRRAMFELTMQVVAHADKFPPGYGQQSREYLAGQSEHALGIIRNLENGVDAGVWIYAMHSEIAEWDETMRAALASLVKSGYFDERMLNLLKRIRCKNDPAQTECGPVAATAPAQ